MVPHTLEEMQTTLLNLLHVQETNPTGVYW